jgi:hypothetical protein
MRENPRLTTLCCSISRTVWTNAFIDDCGLALQAAIISSWSYLCTPAVNYIVSWLPAISILSYSHPIACCCLILRHLVLCTFSKCASWAIFSVAAIAASEWTNWCLRCSCVSARGASDEAPAVRLNWDWIIPGWAVSGAITCCCGKDEEDDNEKWNVLRNIS